MAFISVARLQPASPPPPLQNEAGAIVTGVMAEAGALATAAQASALDAITTLGNFHLTLPPLVPPAAPALTVSVPTLGPLPVEPDGTSASFPSLPPAAALGELAPLTLDPAPGYDLSAPLLVDVPLPDPLAALLPAAPQLDTVSLPVSPDFVLPAVPTLLGLNLPSTPVLDLPAFTDQLPDAPLAPNADFSFSELTYNTALLGQMNSRLVDLVGGMSTGLTPAVEDALWQRARDREALLAQRAVDEATRMFAARGFAIPSGTLARMIQQALAESIGRDASLSREVMVKQAELEQSNFQFAFNAAVALESRLIEHFNQVQGRALDAAKFQFDAVVRIFQARVQLYQADVQAFGMKAEVFKTRLQAALAQLDIYRAELEGQKLVGELNSQLVSQYVAQLEGVKTSADVYRTRVEAVKAQIEAQQQQVSVYVAQLQGYDSQVRSKATEYEAYATRVRAELTRVQMFGEEVAAYKSRVEAYGTLVNAKLGAQTLEFKQTQEFPLEVYRQQVATYQAGVSAEAERLRALIGLFEGRVRAFAATEGAKEAQVNAQVEAGRLAASVFTSSAGLNLQAGETNLRLSLSAAETAQASLRAAGQVSGQLAAAALAARNVHASISQSDGNSTSNNASTSNSNAAGWNDSGSVADITTHRGSDA